MTAVGEGFTKAASDLVHGFGKGLEDVAKRAEKADGEAAKGFKSLDHPHPVHAPNLKDEPPVAVVAPLGKSGPGSRFMNPVEGGRVPAYTKKLGTRGILHLPGQEPLALASGKQGPSMAVRNKGINGFTGNQLLHVEGHTSAQMRITGTMEADLEINRIPCIDGKGGGCDGLLPKMLPEGAKLRIYGPGGYYNEYVGLPDR